MLKLLFFTGTYCPSCKAMYPIIDSLEQEYASSLIIERLNVENDVEKTSTFTITSIPTFIFVKNDQPFEKLVGPQIKSKLVKTIIANQ